MPGSQGRTSDARVYDLRDRYSYLEVGCDQYVSIWVIVNRMTKFSHFLAVKTTYFVEDYARIYINEIVRLHGVLLSIISDRGLQLTSHFWKSFQKGLGAQVNLSITFCP